MDATSLVGVIFLVSIYFFARAIYLAAKHLPGGKNQAFFGGIAIVCCFVISAFTPSAKAQGGNGGGSSSVAQNPEHKHYSEEPIKHKSAAENEHAYMVAQQATWKAQQDAAAAQARADAPAPTDAPAATDPPAESDKQQEIDQIDSSVTADKIVGNPTKYTGTVVKLSCTIGNVVSGGDDGSKVANATCDGAAIVLTGDRIGELDTGDQYTVVGHVDDPMQGTNLMGGSVNFPTVKFEYNL